MAKGLPATASNGTVVLADIVPSRSAHTMARWSLATLAPTATAADPTNPNSSAGRPPRGRACSTGVTMPASIRLRAKAVIVPALTPTWRAMSAREMGPWRPISRSTALRLTSRSAAPGAPFRINQPPMLASLTLVTEDSRRHLCLSRAGPER